MLFLLRTRRLIPHISVWGSSFVGWHPARIRRSFLPSSSPPPPSVAHSLTHCHSLTHSLTHSITPLTHSGSLRRLQKGLRRAWSPLGARLSPQWPAQCPETAEGAAARVVAAGSPALSAVSGAVSRDCRRACGARGRRWGPGSLRSVQRLQKGARGRGPALSAVSGAVSRDCRRGCGARGRRWGPGSLRSGRRSVQRLQKGLRRAWSPLGARLSPQCPAQCPETAEGPAARVVAAGGPALSAVSGAVSRDCRRACGARGRRWGQCPETAEGAAARVVAAGGPCGSVRYCHCDLQSNGCDRLRIAL